MASEPIDGGKILFRFEGAWMIGYWARAANDAEPIELLRVRARMLDGQTADMFKDLCIAMLDRTVKEIFGDAVEGVDFREVSPKE